MHHGVIFRFGSAKVRSPSIFETCFSLDKDIWIAATDYCMYFYIIVLLSIGFYSPVNKLYSVIIFSLLINIVILLLNCLVLILHLYIPFLSLKKLFSLLKHYLDLNITDTALKVSRSLYSFTTSLSHRVENYFPRHLRCYFYNLNCQYPLH